MNRISPQSEVRFGTTILQPPLLTYQALSVPTLIYFQTSLQMVVHSSAFAAESMSAGFPSSLVARLARLT